MKTISALRRMMLISSLCFCVFSGYVHAMEGSDSSSKEVSTPQLAKQLNVGDVVFIHVMPYPFEKVSSTTNSWVNHVGIVVDVAGSDPVIAESTFPFSRTTTLSKFIARSQHGRVAVGRLGTPLTEDQRLAVWKASQSRMGIHYDTGFDLNSRGQFCSRFVREVLAESTGVEVGEVETFKSLLTSNPDTDLTFWKVWYFGYIPWSRQTVTPASLLHSTKLQFVFDGTSS